LKIILALSLLLLLVAHYIAFGAAALTGGALLINSLLCLALVCILFDREIRSRPAAVEINSVATN
jgi:Na+/serine symporter